MDKYAQALTDEETFPSVSVDIIGKKPSRVKHYLWTDVDPGKSSVPLAAYCFMTGYVDSVTFTAVSVWCGFQTGNTIEVSQSIPDVVSKNLNLPTRVQLALALARLFAIADTSEIRFRVIDRQALTSLVAFLSGAFLGRIGDRMGSRTRAWLFLGTMVQALFTMTAALLLWKGGHSSVSTDGPSWTSLEGFAAIAFTSASMGLQGIMGKRINTEFATTIVLTSVWCELMADPNLFQARFVKSRDLKILAVVSLFLGGFLGRTLLEKSGNATTFLIGTGFRILIALWWLRVPGEKLVEEANEREDAGKGKRVERGTEVDKRTEVEKDL